MSAHAREPPDARLVPRATRAPIRSDDAPATTMARLRDADARTRTSAILRLQRSVGNAAVGVLVQRQAVQRQTVQRAFDPSKLTVKDPTPPAPQPATASPKGDDIQVEGPTVTFAASVMANVPSGGKFEDLGGGPRVDVGPTQTLLGSDRIGVYRKGGVPTGALVGERKDHVGQVRDAQTDPKTDKVLPNVVPPWYSVPQALNADTTHVIVNFVDKPGWPAPLKQGEGILTETRGSDRFRTSVAAKPDAGGGLFHLKQFNWEVPWDMKIDPAKGGTGGQGKAAATSDIPPTLEGPIAGEVPATWMAFVSVDEAMKVGSDVLMRYLGPAKRHDPAAFWTIVEALRRKNPTFVLDLKVKKSGNLFFDEKVDIRIKGPSKTAQKGMGKVDTDAPGTVSFSLLEILEPGEIDSGTVLDVEVVKDSDHTKKVTVHYPFVTSPPGEVRVGGSAYDVTWSMRP